MWTAIIKIMDDVINGTWIAERIIEEYKTEDEEEIEDKYYKRKEKIERITKKFSIEENNRPIEIEEQQTRAASNYQTRKHKRAKPKSKDHR